MKAFLCFVLAAGTVTAASAQGLKMPRDAGMPMASGSKAPAASSARSSMPLVDGVVQKVDTAKAMIVLKHGDIPNLGMPPMTMGFDVADKKMLEAVKAGDKVRFQAEMAGGKATVTELKKVR